MSYLFSSDSKIRAWWKDSFSPSARVSIKKWARAAIGVAVLGYLVWKLSTIGWVEVVRSFPQTPVFYVLFVFLYFSLPIGEWVIYSRMWPVLGRGSFPAFLKKRVLNKDFLGYSGELYFFNWLKEKIPSSSPSAGKIIRDVNVLSAIASTLIAALIFALFITWGRVDVSELIGAKNSNYVIVLGLGTALILGVVWRFRNSLFVISRRTASLVLSIYCFRLVLGQGLQIGMWESVLPDVNLDVWITYAAVSLVVSRLPFIPSQDLIFLAVGVEISSAMHVSEAAIAGLLLAASVLDKVLNAVFFVVFSTWKGNDRVVPAHSNALSASDEK